MDKIFRVLLNKDGECVEYYLSSVYDVEVLVDNITSGTVVTIGVLSLTDITRDNVKDFLI